MPNPLQRPFEPGNPSSAAPGAALPGPLCPGVWNTLSRERDKLSPEPFPGRARGYTRPVASMRRRSLSDADLAVWFTVISRTPGLILTRLNAGSAKKGMTSGFFNAS